MAPSGGDQGPGALPRNYQRPCVLLMLAEAPAHGYDLLEQLRALGLERVDTGALYRTLRTMEQEGLVHSWWEPSQLGPDRRTYALTDEGLDWLHAWASSIKDVVRFLRRYTQRYDSFVREGSRTQQR